MKTVFLCKQWSHTLNNIRHINEFYIYISANFVSYNLHLFMYLRLFYLRNITSAVNTAVHCAATIYALYEWFLFEKNERNKRGYRSNARSTHKKLQMKIVNLKNEKRKCSISTLCEYYMTVAIIPWYINIIDQKKNSRRVHTMTTDDDSFFLYCSWLTKEPKMKRKLHEKKDEKNLQNYTNIFLSIFSASKHILSLSLYSLYLNQCACMHAWRLPLNLA